MSVAATLATKGMGPTRRTFWVIRYPKQKKLRPEAPSIWNNCDHRMVPIIIKLSIFNDFFG